MVVMGHQSTIDVLSSSVDGHPVGREAEVDLEDCVPGFLLVCAAMVTRQPGELMVPVA